jgi:hypothetical protein
MNKRVVPTSAGESNGTANDHHILKYNADTASMAIISLAAFTASNFIAHTTFVTQK